MTRHGGRILPLNQWSLNTKMPLHKKRNVPNWQLHPSGAYTDLRRWLT